MLMKRLVCSMMMRSLRAQFRRVCWVGAFPELPPEKPLVLVSNHHSFYDGYLHWFLLEKHVKRTPKLWMEHWDRFPFFGAAGALPFPSEDPKRRSATVRNTAKWLQSDPNGALIYYPEGRLHPAEDGVAPFDATAVVRLGRLFASCTWWPIATHITWWGEDRPTALLTGAHLLERPDGSERELLNSMLHELRTSSPATWEVLLEGQPSAHESWNFSFSKRFFARYL